MYRKRPYEALYNHFVLMARHKKNKVSLTYEEFAELAKTKHCHYCFDYLVWTEYSLNRGRSAASNLDRKDNGKGYTKDNSTPCCVRCNRSKSDLFTYEEWYGMTAYLRERKHNGST